MEHKDLGHYFRDIGEGQTLILKASAYYFLCISQNVWWELGKSCLWKFPCVVGRKLFYGSLWGSN